MKKNVRLRPVSFPADFMEKPLIMPGREHLVLLASRQQQGNTQFIQGTMEIGPDLFRVANDGVRIRVEYLLPILAVEGPQI